MNMKYLLSYTLKNSSSYKSEFFKTKREISSFLKKHLKKIYWHQITLTNPKSSHPRHIIEFDPGINGYSKKHGTLQTHYETGMECTGLVFYEDGIHGAPNPDFDPSKPESRYNFKNYASYDGLTFITSGHIIEFANGKRIGMVKDREFSKQDGFRLSFYPKGYTKTEWVSLFLPENIKVILWTKIKTTT